MKKLLSNKFTFFTIGIINIGLFHYSIMRLFYFLFDSRNAVKSGSIFETIIIDTLLILFFTVPHSLLLSSKVKKSLLQFIPDRLYSTFYSIHASVGLLLIDKFWLSYQVEFNLFSHFNKEVMTALYVVSWLMMFWSMIATGLFRQSGIEEWWKAINNKGMKYSLSYQGPYKVCRHPIYASFLAMIWLTPNMGVMRLFLALSWTIYIFIGAYLKEKRLRRNKTYRSYSENVPAFPFLNKSWDNFLTKRVWRLI